MFSFWELCAYGEIGGEAYASRFERAAACGAAAAALCINAVACEASENDEYGERTIAGPNVEPKDSDRFISGGERREETVRRLVGGVSCAGFAIVQLGVCAVEVSLWVAMAGNRVALV
jgi:hypothetical protein